MYITVYILIGANARVRDKEVKYHKIHNFIHD